MKFFNLIKESFEEQEAQERREEKEWELGPNCPEEGLKAHALLEWLVDNRDVSLRTDEEIVLSEKLKKQIELLNQQFEESEDSKSATGLLDKISELEDQLEEIEQKFDVYNLVPSGEFYDMTEFETIGELEGRRYAVGTESETKTSAEERVEQLIDEIGYEGFNSSFARGFLNEYKILEEAENYFTDAIYDNPDGYLDESDRMLSDRQEEEIQLSERRISQMERQIEMLEEMKDGVNDDEIDDKISEFEDLIQETEDDIEDIRDNPNGEYPEELVSDKVEELLGDVRRDPESFLSDYGLDWKDFIDKEDFIDGVIDQDGYGHTLNGYDGNADEVDILGTTYWVMRID